MNTFIKKLGIIIISSLAIPIVSSCNNGGSTHEPRVPPKIDLYKKQKVYQEDGKTVYLTIEYEYNDKDLVTKETWFNSDAEKEYTRTYEYDEYENLTSLDELDERMGQHTYYRYQNKYDEQGRLTEIIEEENDGDQWEKSNKETYTYNNNTKTIEYYSYYFDMVTHTESYAYNSRGYLTNYKYLSEDTTTEHVYKINKNGCATHYDGYHLNGEGKMEHYQSVDLTYLKHIWYRPLKESRHDILMNNDWFTECEYNDKKQITLYKKWMVRNEEVISYSEYCTYEY